MTHPPAPGAEPVRTRPRPTGRQWPALVVALLGLQLVLCAVTVFYATGDPSVAVEPDYYQKAKAWDEHAAAVRDAEALGWKPRLSIGGGVGPGSRPVMLKLADRHGEPIDHAIVGLTAFARARGTQRIELTLPRLAPGVYQAAMPVHRTGEWELRFTARRGDDRWLWTTNQTIGRTGDE